MLEGMKRRWPVVSMRRATRAYARARARLVRREEQTASHASQDAVYEPCSMKPGSVPLAITPQGSDEKASGDSYDTKTGNITPAGIPSYTGKAGMTRGK
jgi:hypothetical protein